MITINDKEYRTLEEQVCYLTRKVKELEESGGGGEGTKNYNELNNKPSVNGVELSGNKTSADLGIVDHDTTYSAGTGISLNGTTFSINNTVATKAGVNAIFNYNDGVLNITTM